MTHIDKQQQPQSCSSSSSCIRTVHLRSVFVAAVEQEERVGFAEEIFLVELFAAPLHGDLLLTRAHPLSIAVDAALRCALSRAFHPFLAGPLALEVRKNFSTALSLSKNYEEERKMPLMPL